MKIDPQQMKPLSFYIGDPCPEYELRMPEMEVDVEEQEAYNRLLVAFERVYERRYEELAQPEFECSFELGQLMFIAGQVMKLLRDGEYYQMSKLRNLIQAMREYDDLE